MAQTDKPIDSDRFRSVLGSYPTGVAVVTGLDKTGEPIGMVVGTFTSVSIEPPLVAFLPMKSSRTFHNLREASDRFCINILAADQESVCRTLAGPGEHKFATVSWHKSPGGNPIIDGVVAWIDCTYANVIEGGDHYIVLGSVEAMDRSRDTTPLLFFQRGYGRFTAGPMVIASERETLHYARLAEIAREEIEKLASTSRLECSLVAPVGNDAVYVAVADHSDQRRASSRLGARVPVTPPLGTLFVGKSNNLEEETWLSRLGKASPETYDEARAKLKRVHSRGWSAALLGKLTPDELEQAVVTYSSPQRTPEQERHFLSCVAVMFDMHEPEEFAAEEKYDVLHLSVPVRKSNGEVALALRLGALPARLPGSTLQDYIDLLKSASTRIEQLIAAQSELERA